MTLRFAAMLLCAVGCFKPNVKDGFVCPDGECPDGFTCCPADGVCREHCDGGDVCIHEPDEWCDTSSESCENCPADCACPWCSLVWQDGCRPDEGCYVDPYSEPYCDVQGVSADFCSFSTDCAPGFYCKPEDGYCYVMCDANYLLSCGADPVECWPREELPAGVGVCVGT